MLHRLGHARCGANGLYRPKRRTPHTKEKRGKWVYANSAILNMERHLDSVTETLFDKLSSFSETEEVIEMFDWLRYFVFDAIEMFTV